MGCDIHGPWLERYVDDVPNPRWDTVAEFDVSRNYVLFGALTGGEVRYDEGTFTGPKPKGFPLDADWNAADEYYLFFVEDASDGGDDIDIEDAYRYVDEYGCKFVKRDWRSATLHDFIPENTKTGYVTHPDWHSASWLTYEELAKALEEYDIEAARHPGYNSAFTHAHIALGAMKVLHDAGVKTRLVFYFDN